MSDVNFDLDAKSRSDVGKGASRRLRRLEDMVPAIIYGGSTEPENIMLEHRVVTKALEHEAFYSHILTLTVNNKKQKVVLKSVQRHPYKARIQHLDFLRINASEHINMHVPIHFEGEEACVGVKAGGVLNKQVTETEIRCLPSALPEFLSVDISGLELDSALHLSDIKLPKGVEIVALAHDNDMPLVSIHIPRVQEEEAPAPAEAEGSSATGSSATSPSSSSEAPSDKSKK
ncbi:MAG: 50S ribosomal protein L25/general stress protein Ctc [Legionellales bacterium]|nr:50S ribosomal protein L25/general stress protein Ctc [Legionellales bacterium]|tara:strand:+ start:466 stop:1158 length:693 start_codon:yes stop_codon:yes gene_type:complete